MAGSFGVSVAVSLCRQSELPSVRVGRCILSIFHFCHPQVHVLLLARTSGLPNSSISLISLIAVQETGTHDANRLR